MRHSTIDVFITVKAYPNPSAALGEAACIAGISRDHKWVRLYPIPFRDLEREKQFKKYQWVRVAYAKTKTDTRPETVRPALDSIAVLSEPISTTDNWMARWDLLRPMLSRSLCEIQRAQQLNGTSLGLFRPKEVYDVEVKPEDREWTEAELAKLGQKDLFLTREKKLLEKIPYSFSYRFRCHDCVTKEPHCLKIIDWELAELWRNSRRSHDEEKSIELVRTKFLDAMCGPEREPAFFTGNMQLHPASFLMLGVVWPRRDSQLSLFD